MSEPVWVDALTILLLQGEALAEHGGLEGVRDQGMLESALARPRNLYLYEGVKDLPRLAACHAVGIAKNHPFSDGNKRAAFIALAVFLARNGLRIRASQVDVVNEIFGVAAGQIEEEELAAWIRQHLYEPPEP